MTAPGLSPDKFLVFGFWVLVCCAATQPAIQVRQECADIQVVYSNREAQKRPAESKGTPAMDLGFEDICDHVKAGNTPREGVYVGDQFGSVCFVSIREDQRASDSECGVHGKGAAACGRAGLLIGLTDRSTNNP